MTSVDISEERIAKTSVAPRVTLADRDDNIASIHYFTAGEADEAHRLKHEADDFRAFSPAPTPLKLLTFCVLVLKNGFTVTGQSACVSPDNYNQKLGEEIALENAKKEIWALMGYALAEKLHNEKELRASVLVPPHDDMPAYIGTKVVNAKPMNRLDYNKLRGWQLPNDENGEDEGYLVEYTDKLDGNVPGYNGYISWSPKDVFERAYK